MTIAMAESTDPQSAGSDDALEAARREKLRKLEALDVDPWGARFDAHRPIAQIRQLESEIVTLPPAAGEQHGQQQGPRVRAAGRIVLMRDTGKLIFADIRDWTGQIQLYIGKKQVGDQNWAISQCFDLGDIIGVDGELKRTKTGELTIFVDDLQFLTKSLETPPDKFHGLNDPELRQRQRYLDLIHGDGVLPRFLNRTKIVQSIRQTLAGEGFVEVEGPTLHSIAGGAAARPFVTHHNTLDMELFLRIALELHLKRLMVGGIERVYELGRVYRNEGISPRHNPEFTMLELYQAYGDYRSMMDLTEKLIVGAIRATGQDTKLPCGECDDRLHAAVCPAHLRRAVPAAHRNRWQRSRGDQSLGRKDRLRHRRQASRRDQERSVRREGRRPPDRPDVRDRLSGEHLPADEAQAR